MPTSHVNAVASTIPPFAVQQRIGTTAARFALNTMLMPRTDSGLTYIDYRSGVMASGDGGNTHLAMKVTAATGLTVTVNQGNCVINTSGQGAYMCCLDSQKTITIPAASSTGNRYDLVVATVYDDNNTVINSPAGTRQFTVELIQGDTISGVPSVPTAGAGQIPLASVYVPANATALTGTDPNTGKSQIADLRGPGLVARGGMRSLYGSDAVPGSAAFSQAGAYPGDQRWVHANNFQHQVYYGSSQGWRGVHNCLVYTAKPTSAGNWVYNGGTSADICSLTIPDPGTPYMIYPTARVFVVQSTTTTLDMRIQMSNPGVAGGAFQLVSWNRHDTGNVGPAGSGSDTHQGFNVAPVMWGPLTGQTVVKIQGYVWGSAQTGQGYILDSYGDTLLSVNVYPSTVPPSP